MNLNPILPHAAAYAARCESELLTAPARGTSRPNRPSLATRALRALTAALDRAPERPAPETAAWRRTPARSN